MTDTEEQEAVKAAYRHQVRLLFGNLIFNLIDGDVAGATDRFSRGIEIAKQARRIALVVVQHVGRA